MKDEKSTDKKAEPKKPTAAKLTTEERLNRKIKQLTEDKNALLEASADRSELVEAVINSLAGQPEIEVIEKPAGDHQGDRTLMLFLSDIHIGQLFNERHGGGMGKYDLSAYNQRAVTLAQKVVQTRDELSRSGEIDRCIVVFGGDHIDGRTIHPGHDHESAVMADQLRIGPEIMARTVLKPLAKAFKTVEVLAVPGNHGRLGRKGEMERVGDSLDLVFMDILKLRCQPLKNVKWHDWNSWFQYFTIYDHKFFVAHGDAFSSWLGIPFYGAQRYKQRVESLIHSPLDVFMCGHHHSPAAWHTAFSSIVMNGSWVGTGNFGAWLGLGGAPTQKLILVTEESAVAANYDIILEHRSTMMTTTPVRI